MQSKTMRCIRCDGRKKMYTMNGGYTHANMGGVLVDCPLCLGIGKITVVEDSIWGSSIDDIKEEIIAQKFSEKLLMEKETTKIKNKKEKDSKDAKDSREITEKA